MKRILASAIGIALVGWLAGCEADRANGPTPVGTETPGLERSTFDLDDLDYEEITGTLLPGSGGVMSQNLTSWPKNCRFSLTVPAEAVPETGPPIPFSVKVPTQASYVEYASELSDPDRLIIRLEPDGMQFTAPVTVGGTWMPWMLGVGETLPDTLMYTSGPDSGLAVVTQFGNRYRVSFEVDHFSDWEVCPIPDP